MNLEEHPASPGLAGQLRRALPALLRRQASWNQAIPRSGKGGTHAQFLQTRGFLFTPSVPRERRDIPHNARTSPVWEQSSHVFPQGLGERGPPLQLRLTPWAQLTLPPGGMTGWRTCACLFLHALLWPCESPLLLQAYFLTQGSPSPRP